MFTLFTITIILLILIIIGNPVLAIGYTNYTSEKYGIQFEYPSDWTVTERTSRLDIGDIKIESGSHIFFIISRYDTPENILGGLDVKTTTESMIKWFQSSSGDYINTINATSYITIDGKKSGTFLISLKFKDATQQWFVSVGDSIYQIMNFEPISDFENPENIETRNHFINSIKFLGDIEPLFDLSNDHTLLQYEEEKIET